jgi:hypothetical protein
MKGDFVDVLFFLCFHLLHRQLAKIIHTLVGQAHELSSNFRFRLVLGRTSLLLRALLLESSGQESQETFNKILLLVEKT